MSDNSILKREPNEFDTRDAVHIAICPAIAWAKLKPGQHVGFMDKAKNTWGPSTKNLGVVSPFLTKDLARDEKFWVLLYPDTISSLRHVWSHTEFPEEIPAQKVKSEAVLAIEQIARRLDVEYDELMDAAKRYVVYGDYWSEGGKFEGVQLPYDFWEHYEEVTSTHVDEDDKHSFFSCSC